MGNIHKALTEVDEIQQGLLPKKSGIEFLEEVRNAKENKWLIKERLTRKQLLKEINKLNAIYGGNSYRHKESGGHYFISGTTVINQNGQAEWGFMYHPRADDYDDDYIDRLIPHTRPINEFLDGRFELA